MSKKLERYQHIFLNHLGDGCSSKDIISCYSIPESEIDILIKDGFIYKEGDEYKLTVLGNEIYQLIKDRSRDTAPKDGTLVIIHYTGYNGISRSEKAFWKNSFWQTKTIGQVEDVLVHYWSLINEYTCPEDFYTVPEKCKEADYGTPDDGRINYQDEVLDTYSRPFKYTSDN
jgi:hypothetical protein